MKPFGCNSTPIIRLKERKKRKKKLKRKKNKARARERDTKNLFTYLSIQSVHPPTRLVGKINFLGENTEPISVNFSLGLNQDEHKTVQ